MSYNIHKAIGGVDRLYRLERIIDVIDAENPDLICLQEVDRNVRRSRFDDQPKLLQRIFHPAEAIFQLNVHLKTGGYGNLVLSRWPIVTKHRLSLRFRQKKPRGAIDVVIDTPEGKLHLVNWHLGLADKERHFQARHLLGHHLFKESADLPTIIIGDFNDWRNTLAVGPLREHGFRPATSPPSRYRSFPAFAPFGSLDKAYVRGMIDIRRAHVVRNSLSHRASDHLPVVVDFHLNGFE
ncbi:MAG: endonuclease/exonuclease/phosphatase family protein [Planctomycetota bacterium]|jgi:endonuclease/exonuclease/phosphatase family metal-dependent hydrolase|nr:endonuclease/exonuclease/phosphatase family protein [Planctomycetota bacterium]